MTTRTTAIANHFAGIAAASDPDALHIGDRVTVRSIDPWELDQPGTVTSISADGRIYTVAYDTGWRILTGPARLTRAPRYTVVMRGTRTIEVATFDKYADAVTCRDDRNNGTGSVLYTIVTA